MFTEKRDIAQLLNIILYWIMDMENIIIYLKKKENYYLLFLGMQMKKDLPKDRLCNNLLEKVIILIKYENINIKK